MTLPELTVIGGQAVEGDDVVFTVSLSQPSTGQVTVDWRTVADGSAVDTSDYYGGNGTLTFAPGETLGTILIHAPLDGTDSVDRNFSLALSDPVNAVLAGGEKTLTATGVVLDDDGSTFDRGLFVSDPVIQEGETGSKQAVFELRLSEAASSDITLSYRTVNGSAKAGQDYVARDGTVTILAGDTTAHVAVTVKGDAVVEGDETFSLVVTPTADIANGAADSVGVATILDDDPVTASTPVVSIIGGQAVEGDDVVFTVSLSQPSTGEVTVDWRTVADGSAVDSSDYYGGSGTLTFAPGETVGTILIHAPLDGTDSVDRNFSLALSDPVNAVLAGGEKTLTATGVVLDDDGSTFDRGLFVSDPVIQEGETGSRQVVFEVRLSEPSANDITLHYQTADGTATAGQDYVARSGTITFHAGQTVASIAVTVKGDAVVEGDETFSLVVTPTVDIANGVADSAGVATILDDDPVSASTPVVSIIGGQAVEGDDVVFTVSLSQPSTGQVTVDWRTVADGSAVDSSDYYGGNGTLTFAPGETVGTILIHAPLDGTDSVDRNFSLSLSDPVNAVLAGGEKTLTATGVVLDDDGSTFDRGLFVSDPVIQEGETGSRQVVFEVRLSEAASSDITLSYHTADGTAKAGKDYIARSGTVTFHAGQTVASVAVTVKGDVKVEPSETFSLVVTPTVEIANGTADSTGVATILNAFPSNDLIHGTSAGDNLFAGGGNDTVFGGGGNDTIFGSIGSDHLNGNGGNDMLFGGGGPDTLVGGLGADTLNGAGGRDLADYSASGAAVTVNLATGAASGGHATDDHLIHIENLAGSSFSDHLTGNNGANLIIGGAGSDKLGGLGGADTLKGGGGGDLLDGGSGNDRLLGGAGGDRLAGAAGDDTLAGGDGNDRLNGNFGNDKLIGGDGSDTLNGGGGNDLLVGGAGPDRFVFADGFGNDTIADFAAGNVEKIGLSGVSAITGFADLINHHLMAQSGTGFAVIVDGADSIVLDGVKAVDIGFGEAYSAQDFIF